MVRHFLADGREVESIKGFVVPATGATEAVYRIIEDFMRRKHRENNGAKNTRKLPGKEKNEEKRTA